MIEPNAKFPDPSQPPDSVSDASLTHELCEADQRAVEALLASWEASSTIPLSGGQVVARVAGDSHINAAATSDHVLRVRRCEALLAQLDVLHVSSDQTLSDQTLLDQTLIDATIARVVLARREQSPAELSAADEDAIEALILADYDPARCPSGLRALATRHAQALQKLHVDLAPASRESLVSATLERVQASIDAGEHRRVVSPASNARSRPRFRWSDLVSVAAILLIGGAVILPMVGAMRGFAQRNTCQAGMLTAMRGFAGYANDFRESLPLASSSKPGSVWWNIGKAEESNSANLFTLARTRHASPDDLACPGNATACRDTAENRMDWPTADGVSYSYQNMFAHERPRWTQPDRAVVMADRSPVMVRAMRQQLIDPVANSDNHLGRGQNVLFSDGAVNWMSTPVLESGDNIWLPRILEETIARFSQPQMPSPIRGTESPEGLRDAFLTP